VHDLLPGVSVTVPGVLEASSHENVQVCVSGVPTSVKVADTVAAVSSARGSVGPVTLAITGGTLFTIRGNEAWVLPPLPSLAVMMTVWLSGRPPSVVAKDQLHDPLFVPVFVTVPTEAERVTLTPHKSKYFPVFAAVVPSFTVTDPLSSVSWGAVVSRTVTLESQELGFPELSVALQLTGVEPSENVEPDAGQLVGAAPQRSEAVALKETAAPVGPVHSTVGAGQLMVGGVVSLTVTKELQELGFPESSVALQVTGVEPSGNVSPDVGQFVEAVPQRSKAVALKEAAAPTGPVHSTTVGAGQVMVGGVVSTTVTEEGQGLLEFPELSVALQLTGVEPSKNVEPEAGLQLKVMTPQLSPTVGSS